MQRFKQIDLPSVTLPAKRHRAPNSDTKGQKWCGPGTTWQNRDVPPLETNLKRLWLLHYSNWIEMSSKNPNQDRICAVAASIFQGSRFGTSRSVPEPLAKLHWPRRSVRDAYRSNPEQVLPGLRSCQALDISKETVWEKKPLRSSQPGANVAIQIPCDDFLRSANTLLNPARSKRSIHPWLVILGLQPSKMLGIKTFVTTLILRQNVG